MDSEGNIVKEFKPLHDGTMAGREGVFDLIEAYLRNLEIEQLERIVFCGDGAKWVLRQAQHKFGTARKSCVSAWGLIKTRFIRYLIGLMPSRICMSFSSWSARKNGQ